VLIKKTVKSGGVYFLRLTKSQKICRALRSNTL